MKTTKLMSVSKIVLATFACVIASAMTMKVSASPTRVDDEVQWTEINLEMPGSLGFEALYIFDKLSDIQHLRVSGPLNEADWTSLKNMTSLVNLDLSRAQSSAIPDYQFQDRTSLQTFILPEGIQTIGRDALQNTGIVEIEIPSTVTEVKDDCFYRSKQLESVNWKASANIPYYCFYGCDKLKKVSLADGLSVIDSSAFSECYDLSEINLPYSLKEIGASAFYNTTSLKEIVFPESLASITDGAFRSSGLKKAILPEKLQELGAQVFYECDSIQEVVMPATIFNYKGGLFGHCENLKKITLPVATPPSIDGNILYDCDMSQIELIVPTFAAVNYKLDTFWLQCGEIKGELESNYWALNSDLALTNDRRMAGTPSIDLFTGAKLTIGGVAPAPFNQIRLQNDWRLYNSNGNWKDYEFAQLINNCPNVSANGFQFETYGHEKQWYFISMPCDVKLSNISHSENAEFVIRYYDGEARAADGVGGSWKDVPAGGTLEAGKAYIYQTNEPGWLIFTADNAAVADFLKSGDRTVPVKAWAGVGETANPADNGWNLIGNPFASYFDMAATSLSCPITVWNHRYNRYDAYSLIDDDVVLYPFQAFFMQQADADATITFAADGRQFTSEKTYQSGSRVKADSSRLIFNLELSGATNVTDKARVVLNDGASLAYESSCDASKFFSSESNGAYIYTIDADENYLAINERPADDCMVRVGINVPFKGSWNIKATRSDCEVILHDNVTGNDFELSQDTSYQFSTEESGALDDRFTLHFLNLSTGVQAEETGSRNVHVTSETGAVVVEGAAGESVNVYTISGVNAASVESASMIEKISLPAGFYIVKTNQKSVKCVVK